MARAAKRDMVPIIRRAIKIDKGTVLQKASVDIRHTFYSDKPKVAWKALSLVLAFSGKRCKFSRALPMLQDHGGNLLDPALEMDAAKITLFGKMRTLTSVVFFNYALGIIPITPITLVSYAMSAFPQ